MIKNPEVNTGLVTRLLLDDSLYAGNVLIKNRDRRAYIKIMNIRDIDKRIIIPEVESEE